MIEYDSHKISKYWSKFTRSISIQFFLLQLFGVLLVAILLFFFAELDLMSLNFWLAIAIYLVIFVTVSSILIKHILKPQSELIQLISQISNNYSTTKMPDLYSERYTQNGFSDILKFIYSLDQTPIDISEENDNSQTGSIFEMLDKSKMGIMTLNKNNEITHRSGSSPDLKSLVFTSQISLLDWLKETRKDKICDENFWRRVPNGTAEDDDRRIYDVFVHYKKDSTQDAVIFFVDKTDEYFPDEDNLNFIAFAAHELRGPITIIRGYLDVLNMELSDKLSAEQIELFDRLIVSSNKLSGYVNNILNVSRFDRNRMSFDLSEHSIGEVIDSVREDIELRAISQRRILEIMIDKSLPKVAADLSSISEVLTNIADNAIKYSNEGGLIKIYAARVGDFIDISVEDFGIGIPSGVMSNLFQKFYRSHRSRETVAGTGIGLYISRAIVEGHGGQISVKSIEGEGSTFTISLPIYDNIKDRLLNEDFGIVKQPGGGWIKNHGKIRG